MVRAILDGRKTMTRRIVKPQPEIRDYGCWYPPVPVNERWRSAKHYANEAHMRRGLPMDFNPYGQPGDRLWVKETWSLPAIFDALKPSDPSLGPRAKETVRYLADGNKSGKTRVSIHMPRWASRITLEITNIRVERLQDMHHKADQFEAEGIVLPPSELYQDINGSDKLERHFIKLWDSINGPGAWDKNPWVWVIEFKRVVA